MLLVSIVCSVSSSLMYPPAIYCRRKCFALHTYGLIVAADSYSCVIHRDGSLSFLWGQSHNRRDTAHSCFDDTVHHSGVGNTLIDVDPLVLTSNLFRRNCVASHRVLEVCLWACVRRLLFELGAKRHATARIVRANHHICPKFTRTTQRARTGQTCAMTKTRKVPAARRLMGP